MNGVGDIHVRHMPGLRRQSSMADFDRARRHMVDNQLRTSHVTDRRLLARMGALPRELFVAEERRAVAYADDVQPVGSHTMAAPAMFAKLAQLAAVTAADNVLDIGVGTGYSTAVFAGLAASVLGLEEDTALADQANANLTALGIGNARVVSQLETIGATPLYDVVFLNGAVEQVPQSFFAHLAEGGRLIALIRQGIVAVAHVYVRSGGEISSRAEFNANLPPLFSAPRKVEFVF